MRSHSLRRLACLLLLGAGCGYAAGVRLASVEPTVLFPRSEPLRQVAILSVFNDSAEAVQLQATVQLPGRSPEPAIPVTAAPGVSRHRVLVPDIQQPADVTFELKSPNGTRIDGRTLSWKPQRKWKVFVIRSSHEDLGYENYIFRKQHDIANFIDLARELSGHTENLSELERRSDARFHYTMETLLFQRNYIEERGEAAWRKLVNRDVKTGRIHLAGAPSGVHSHWMDYEELVRMTYPAKRETLDRFGLDLKTFMIVDNPSLSSSGAQVLANAGFRYVARWGQGWRTGGNNNYATTKLPALFWWRTPDGSRILFGWRSHYAQPFWYGQMAGAYSSVMDLGSENVSRTLQRVESGEMLGPYPYDALVNPQYTDHDVPYADARALPAWSQQYAYPLIKMASPDEFFEYIEEKYSSQLPELSGDLNNFSADYASIDPESQAWKRRAARVLPFAEGLAAIASRLDMKFKPITAEAARTYTRMYDYDEHSWPTLPPATDVQLFNANWVKKHEADRAHKAADELLQRAWAPIARQIPAAAQTVVVFNPLAHTRDDVVVVEGSYHSLIDNVTGQPVVCQTIEGNKTTFIAKAVPAYGYKTYRVDATAKPAGGSGLQSRAGPDLEPALYRPLRY
jgi:hypothetical protein